MSIKKFFNFLRINIFVILDDYVFYVFDDLYVIFCVYDCQIIGMYLLFFINCIVGLCFFVLVVFYYGIILVVQFIFFFGGNGIVVGINDFYFLVWVDFVYGFVVFIKWIIVCCYMIYWVGFGLFVYYGDFLYVYLGYYVVYYISRIGVVSYNVGV